MTDSGHAELQTHAATQTGTLLLVDDEPRVLKALARLLSGEPYHLHLAGNVSEALEVLEREPVGVIVTDQRMPEVSGIEFLSKIKESHPDTVRIVLTGHADLEVAMEAINSGAVYKLLTKPWEPESLKTCLRQAFAFHRLLRDRRRLTEEIARANGELKAVNIELATQVNRQALALEHMSRFDTLTGLLNKESLMDRLDKEMARCVRLSVLVISVGRLALINKGYGYALGDKVLCAVADRLRRSVRHGDTLARCGGAEFAVLLPELSRVAEIQRVVDRIGRGLRAPLTIDGQRLPVSPSIGISAYPAQARTPDALVKNAYAAMRHAKDEGGGCRFFDQAIDRQAAHRVRLEQALRRALEQDEFELHYQPQACLVTRRLTGAECLIRWRHPEDGLVPAGEFIPVLEGCDLILAVGQWVFRRACRHLRSWRDQGLAPGRLAVNLSMRQFDDSRLPAMLAEAAREAGIDPRAAGLELEITESLVARDPEQVIDKLHEISAMGFRIAVDDFGSGYASLNYLTRFPVDMLKIDASFIRRLSEHRRDAQIVEAIVRMAHSLGIAVIAEGVESEAQAKQLRAFGCDEMQGYLYSPPLPGEAMTRLLAAQPRARQVGE